MSKILDKLADQHEQRIISVLYTLETDIIKEVTRATKGELVSQRIAIQLQPRLRAVIQSTFLEEADLIINEEYNKIAKEVFEEMFISKKNAKEIIDNKGLKQISNEDDIEKLVDKIILENESQVKQFKEGNTKVIGWFVGQVMKVTKGQANPAIVNKIISKKLSN